MLWKFYDVWNNSLENGKNRSLEARQKIWASELGGSLIDRFLKMTAVSPSNPPNPRSRRKFEAGNIWEAIIVYVLSRAGILLDKQQWVSYTYPGLFPVSGRLDCLAGGKPDYQKALSLLDKEFQWLPEFVSRATYGIIKDLAEKYPKGLEEIILEIKSCSSFMFERYEKALQGSLQHQLQLFHYLKALTKPEGHIVYVSKDDARLIEIEVLNPSEIEDIYHKDVTDITNYVLKNERPPLEKSIVFDNMFGKFSANWKVGYSNYLTYLYNLESQFAFDNKYKPIVERWNRVLSRIVKGEKMTDNNKEALEEIKKEGFDIDNIILKVKELASLGAVIEE